MWPAALRRASPSALAVGPNAIRFPGSGVQSGPCRPACFDPLALGLALGADQSTGSGPSQRRGSRVIPRGGWRRTGAETCRRCGLTSTGSIRLAGGNPEPPGEGEAPYWEPDDDYDEFGNLIESAEEEREWWRLRVEQKLAQIAVQ